MKAAVEAAVEIIRQNAELARRLIDLAERVAAKDAETNDRHPTARQAEILAVVGDGTMKGEQIAKLLDLEFSGSFRQDLSDMVKASLLVSGRNGYSRG